MNFLSCFIIDDVPSINILSEYIISTKRLKLAGSATDTSSGINSLFMMNSPDLLFINTDKVSNFDINLQEYVLQNQILVIGTSSIMDNAFQAFEAGYFDYLLKPFLYERFLKTISRLIRNLEKYKSLNLRSTTSHNVLNEAFFVKIDTNGGKDMMFKFNDLILVEAMQNYVVLHVESGKAYISYNSMKKMEEHLPKVLFIRIHKSYIINESKITSIDGNIVFLNNNAHKVTIGNTYRKVFLEKIDLKTIKNKKKFIEITS